MRAFLVLAASSLLCLLPSCSETELAPAETPPAEEVPVDESPVDESPVVVPDPPSAPLVIDLGEVTAGADVTFEIPDGALGFNITVEGKAADLDAYQPYGIERITAPNGKVVHDDFTPSGGTNPTSIAQFDTIASVSVPQGEAVPAKLGGVWKMRTGVLGSSTKKPKLKAMIRVQSSGDGAFRGGMLDLHLHVPDGLEVDGRVLDSAKAESDSGIRKRIDMFFDLTSSFLGIEKGEVVFEEESSSYRELDGIDELLEGFAISKGQKDGTKALHVLITNLIAEDGEAFAAGIAPGIPGAATVFGRNVSGIIVTTSESFEMDAYTMLHEVGHFLGLNHTTELDGQSFDPLGDTPKCPSISYDPADLMECPDRTNVMFPAGPIESPVSLSASQKRVYRGSPVYKALGSGDAAMSRRTAHAETKTAPSIERMLRPSGMAASSPIERELALGRCGLSVIDAHALVQRHGRAETIRELRAAAADPALVPFVRGRANIALKALGEPPVKH